KAHRTGRAFDHLHCSLDGVAVQILHLLFGDLAHLLLADLSDRLAPGRFRSAFKLCRLLEKIRYRRRFHLEGEGAILIGGDDHRDWDALLYFLRLRVERLAELHDVKTALAKRG